MKLTLVAQPEKLDGEAELLTSLFQKGLTSYHLRKYELTETEVIELIRKVPSEFHDRIMLHHHHYLMKSFQIKGLHFNRFHQNTGGIEKGNLFFSRSAHSLEELEDIDKGFDYVLLSPIYNSLSKADQFPLLNKEAVKNCLTTKEFPFEIYAMSGVNKKNLVELKSLGFDGAAISGAIWNIFKEEGEEAAVDAFESLKSQIHELS